MKTDEAIVAREPSLTEPPLSEMVWETIRRGKHEVSRFRSPEIRQEFQCALLELTWSALELQRLGL